MRTINNNLDILAKMRDMKGTIKKFNIQSHRVNDKKGKVFALQILNQSQVLIQKLGLENCNFIENENRYGIDLLAINNNNEIIAAFEVEMRTNIWKGDTDFPFSEIKCLERKEYQWRKTEEFFQKIPSKYNYHKDIKTYYMQLNDIGNRSVIISGDEILKNKLVPWKTNVTNEYARAVPLARCINVRI
mgnify:FL=1